MSGDYMKYLLSEMSWKEAQEAFKSISMAIVPLGSNEQHGPHMPLGADWMQAQEIARRLGEKINAIVLPTMPFGWAEYHMDFPGTIYISKKNLYGVMMNVCKCLHKWGIKKIIFINGHGGNLSVLQSVSVSIRKKYGMLSAIVQWWDVLGEVDGIPAMEHGGIVETSMMLAVNPGIVNLKEAIVPTTKPLSEKLKTISLDQVAIDKGFVRVFLRTKDITDYGSMTETEGAKETRDFSKATPAKGKQILDTLVNSLVNFAKEFEKVQLPKPPKE